MWNLNCDTNELICETKTVSDTENRCVVTKGERSRRGKGWEFGIADLHIEWISHRSCCIVRGVRSTFCNKSQWERIGEFIYIYIYSLCVCVYVYIYIQTLDSDDKESPCNAGDPSSIPGSRRSPGEGNGYPLWYSCLESPMDRGAWQAIVHRVTKSQTWLSD